MNQVAIDIRSKALTTTNTHLKKMCFKKCKKCKGSSCPNYYGYISNKKEYYSGILHSRKLKYNDYISKQRQPMDKFDIQLVGGFIVLTILLTIFGGLLL
jgi:hypothetical protein